jgi:hypothetical protein
MSHKPLPLFLIAITAYLFASCASQEQDANVAGVKHFYFEFVDEIQNEITIEIIDEASKIMVQHDYIMSEESASKGWPFYGTIERESKVLKTEMMPPHSNVNRLSPINQLTTHKEGEHTLKVIYTINSINDSTINVDKKSYDWHNNEWQGFSKKMSTEFNIKSSNQPNINKKISRTLIRYTFK